SCDAYSPLNVSYLNSAAKVARADLAFAKVKFFRRGRFPPWKRSSRRNNPKLHTEILVISGVDEDNLIRRGASSFHQIGFYSSCSGFGFASPRPLGSRHFSGIDHNCALRLWVVL